MATVHTLSVACVRRALKRRKADAEAGRALSFDRSLIAQVVAATWGDLSRVHDLGYCATARQAGLLVTVAYAPELVAFNETLDQAAMADEIPAVYSVAAALEILDAVTRAYGVVEVVA